MKMEKQLREFEFTEGGLSEEGRATNLMLDAAAVIEKMRTALQAVDACFDGLDPRIESGMSSAEVASLFNATRESVRAALT